MISLLLPASLYSRAVSSLVPTVFSLWAVTTGSKCVCYNECLWAKIAAFWRDCCCCLWKCSRFTCDLSCLFLCFQSAHLSRIKYVMIFWTISNSISIKQRNRNMVAQFMNKSLCWIVSYFRPDSNLQKYWLVYNWRWGTASPCCWEVECTHLAIEGWESVCVIWGEGKLIPLCRHSVHWMHHWCYYCSGWLDREA